jgi:hypothetical protein
MRAVDKAVFVRVCRRDICQTCHFVGVTDKFRGTSWVQPDRERNNTNVHVAGT